MSGTNKAKGNAARIEGKDKEAAGKAGGNERESAGRTEQVKGGLKQAGEKVKEPGAKSKKAAKDLAGDRTIGAMAADCHERRRNNCQRNCPVNQDTADTMPACRKTVSRSDS